MDDRTLHVSLALLGNLLTSSNCSDVFELRAPGPGLAAVNPQFSACSLVPADSRIIVTLAPGLSYRAGTTLNVKPQQTGLRFRGVAAYAPRTVPLTVLPSLVSAHLVDTNTVRLTMSAASPVLPANLTTAQCNSFIYIANGIVFQKPNAIASCSITNGFPTFTLATPFASGDSINLFPNQYHLRHANLTTGPAYYPAITAVPIIPLPVSATQASPTTLHLLLPAPSTTRTGQLTPSDCNSAIALTYRNKSVETTAPSPFSSCAFSPDNTTLILTLANATNYLPGHYLSFAPNQNTLVIKSAGANSPVAYGSSVTVQIAPAFLATSVLLRSPTEIQVVLAYRALAFDANAAQCNAAVQLLSAEGGVRAEPFASCEVELKAQIGSVLTLTLEPNNYTYAPGMYATDCASLWAVEPKQGYMYGGLAAVLWEKRLYWAMGDTWLM